MRELFVYWRTPATTVSQAIRDVENWQAQLQAAHPGLDARIYRRADEADAATATLMEVYAAQPGAAARGLAIDAALEQRIVGQGQQALAKWLAGPRHVEVFERCLPG